MLLLAFHNSHSLHTKGPSGPEKQNLFNIFLLKNYSMFIFLKCTILEKILCKGCNTCQINKPYPNHKQIAEKQDLKGQSLYFNHRISFDTKGLISPSSEGNSFIMVIIDAFKHYVALHSVSHCKACYAHKNFYEHWIAKVGLPEILCTDNGTEFINNILY